MKFRLVEDFDDLLLEAKPAIEPGSELEKSLIYDIENTDTPYTELAKKYGLNSYDPIPRLVKSRNLNVSHRKEAGRFSLIKPSSELEQEIINDIENTNKPYIEIAKEHGWSVQTIYKFIKRKNLNVEHRGASKYYVYLNTLKADIQGIRPTGILSKMKFLPSIYLGYYTGATARGMYDHVRKKYLKGKVQSESLLEFYLKLASNEISLDTLITELRNSQPELTGWHPNSKYDFITISTDELPTVDFYSADYAQLSKDILTYLSRTSYNADNYYSDLKDISAKIAPKTAASIDQTNTYINNNLENIAHNIYSEKGDIIEATNYIKGIPYETSFDISSPQDIATCMKPYKGYLLYGFMDTDGDVVYIGISIFAANRGDFYDKETRSLILKAFEDKRLKKLIVFKSNLPVQNRSTNIQLTYALESYFAEQLFKTYPENYPKALNKAKPGLNSSGLISSQRMVDFEIYLSEQATLLDGKEFSLAAQKILKINRTDSVFPYYKYAQNYISEHKADLSVRDKEILYRSLPTNKISILWNICSSESEYKQIAQINTMNKRGRDILSRWKNYRIENNLPITEDLDDDIDMEYYV